MSCMWLWHLYCNAFAYILSSHACCEQSCIHPRQATVSLHHLFEKTLESCCLDTFLWKPHYVPHALSLRTCILSTPSTRSLYADLLCRIYLPECLSRSPQQDPVDQYIWRFLVQDVYVKIFLAGSCRSTCTRSVYEDLCKMSGSFTSTCARSVYVDLLCKISLSGSLHQDPVGPLVQDLCMRISCPRSLSHDACIRIL